MSEQSRVETVIRFHYDLYEPGGKLMESSRGGEPVSILHGNADVVRGLENALAGRRAGDRFVVEVTPAEGYGDRVEGLIERVSRKHLPNGKRLKAGDRTVMRTRNGQRHVTVAKAGSKMVDVDLNHPMAGMVLRFDVEVTETRSATVEEIAHGHVHGPGGHHH